MWEVEMLDHAMSRMQRLASIAALLLIEGCAAVGASNVGEPPRSKAVIGHLLTRDALITIHASTRGPRFTIQTTGGRLLYKDLDLQELEARYPAAHSLYHSGMAGEAAPLDASLWPHPESKGGAELDF
jgi:hypothetical protein